MTKNIAQVLAPFRPPLTFTVLWIIFSFSVISFFINLRSFFFNCAFIFLIFFLFFLFTFCQVFKHPSISPTTTHTLINDLFTHKLYLLFFHLFSHLGGEQPFYFPLTFSFLSLSFFFPFYNLVRLFHFFFSKQKQNSKQANNQLANRRTNELTANHKQNQTSTRQPWFTGQSNFGINQNTPTIK